MEPLSGLLRPAIEAVRKRHSPRVASRASYSTLTWEHMLHFWLIPALIVLALVLWGLYLLIANKGGSGARKEGRTLVDEPTEQSDPPP